MSESTSIGTNFVPVLFARFAWFAAQARAMSEDVHQDERTRKQLLRQVGQVFEMLFGLLRRQAACSRKARSRKLWWARSIRFSSA
jgi:hypothetical protein